MKERRLKIIIAIMTFALIGLITIQLYWVANLVKLEEARFGSAVSDAISLVINRIDKQETANVVIRSAVKDNDVPLIWTSEHKTIKQNYSVGDSLFEDTEIEFLTSSDDSAIGVNISVSQNSDSSNSNVIVYSYSNGGKKKEKKVLKKKNLNKFVTKKREVFEDVIEELVTISQVANIEDRIEKEKLDTLLIQEFENAGITADFNFGILNEEKNKFVYLTEKTDPDKLLQAKFKSRLFPEDVISEPNFLIVSFPNQREYVLKSMAATLGLSLLFIILIIVVFYKTVQMLIRQKKITDIKNDLINNITHEFKTPLSTISLACEALNEPKLLADNSAVLKYSKIINDENLRIRNLVDNLLNSAALEKGEFEINKQSISLNENIKQAVQHFDLQIQKRNGSFVMNLNAENDRIIADPFHLSIIMNNIIDNAIKYNESEPHIIISTENSDNKILVEILDNGIGIKRGELKNIFDSFYRVPTGNIQNVQGSGMGLHYVKILTEANNGKVTANSTLGKGTKIKIEFDNE
ncbi:MAG: HAMP domain-containing histidine kinase [Ignavibacteriae bacterium]|nr:sensor histidine kinase [Ignavibacteriota bacterium]NOG98117.1 HAMP domain-containing histidine kinase [Ignavibacteriota bacterium]